MSDEKIVPAKQLGPLLAETRELLAIFVSSINTARRR